MLSAAPEQKPYSLHVRAPQQSQSDMQVEAAAELQPREEIQLGPIERANCGENEEFVPRCGAQFGFRFGLGVGGEDARVALADDKRAAGAAARQTQCTRSSYER